MEKPILFMLTPWFDDDGTGPFYCPDCGIVEGFFAYNPEISAQIEIIHIDFQRPRKRIVDVLGQENQGSPALVVDDKMSDIDGIKRSMTTGRSFIDDPILICDWLARAFNGVQPHPQ